MFAIPKIVRMAAVTAMIAVSGHAVAGDVDWDIRDQLRTAKPNATDGDATSAGDATGCEHFSDKAKKYSENGPCIAISGHVRFQIGNVPD